MKKKNKKGQKTNKNELSEENLEAASGGFHWRPRPVDIILPPSTGKQLMEEGSNKLEK